METIATRLLTEETKRDKRSRKITSTPRRAELVAAYRASGLATETFAPARGTQPAEDGQVRPPGRSAGVGAPSPMGRRARGAGLAL